MSNFENEDLVEVLDFSPQKTFKVTDADHENDLTVINEERSNTLE